MFDSLVSAAAQLTAFTEWRRGKTPDTPQDQPGDFSQLLRKEQTPEAQHSAEAIQTPESVKHSLHIYLPGIMGSEKGMAPIYEKLEEVIHEQFPNAEFIGKNSLISEDFARRPDGDRYVLLSRQISETLAHGQEIYLYGHSLGAVEVTHILQRLKLLQPDLWRTGKGSERIHVVLMSPAGFGKSMSQIARGVGRLKDIVLAGAELSGHIYGLETFAYLPLRKQGSSAEIMEATDAQEHAELLTKFFPSVSQLGRSGEAEPTDRLDQEFMQPDSEQLRARFHSLTDEEKSALHQIDDSIHFYAAKGNTEYVQEYVRRRGRLLSKYSQLAYAGNLPERAHAPDKPNDTELESEQQFPWSAYAQALLGMGRLVGSVLTGNTYRQMKSWKEKGVDISFLIPEFDVLVKVSEIEEFLSEDGDIHDRAIMLRSTTHSSSSVETSVLRDSVKRFADRLEKREGEIGDREGTRTPGLHNVNVAL